MASIDEAKQIIKDTPISTVISYYHSIDKKGANFQGICPFHGDSHPSLVINDAKGIYKCFACGAAGDSIKFVTDKLNLNFIEAIKDIAGNIGVTIEEQFSKEKNPKYEMAIRVLQVTSKLYKKYATDSKPQNFINFLKHRNLNEESVTNFQIGYAPKNNGLTHYLATISESDQKAATSMAKDIGLIRDSKRHQGHYDFYRDRVIFPIWDHSGKVRGFSSRAVLPDQVPKYLNSGESFIFDKGNILYGFNIAKNHIRQQDSVILVEGNMDVVMLHQYGFKNSVATMGVGLSQNSIRLLNNMTKNTFLAMDSDPAGIKAMTKINQAFIEQGVIPKFIDFTPCKDPDEFLNEFGRLKLQEKIDHAKSFIDYLIASEIPESIPESTEKKLAILNKVFEILTPLGSNLMASEKAINCAKALGLKSSHEDVIFEYKSFLTDKTSSRHTNHSKVKAPLAPPQDHMEPPHDFHDVPFMPDDAQQTETIPISKTEQVLLETIITHPECILTDQITEILDKIQHFEVKRIVLWLKEIYLEIDEAEYSLFLKAKMREALPEEINSILASSLFNYTNKKLEKGIANKTLQDLNKRLDEDLLKSQRNALRAKQLNANTDDEGLEVLKEIQQIEEQLLAFRNK
ncbi:MAG: DNA primase [Halobacteriovoraceae bacterium]|jgi:DNA primase|nr:DNA primase [Halobacteriovoraceae bacterium]